VILTTDDKKYQLTKELLDQMRSVDGFPIGKDEDIIALSDPPYYTACPNPWIEDFIKENGKPWDPKTDSYNREPFAADVSEGKNDPIYNAHSYHTKVPHKAIMRYILHYTNPGDIIFDGFCGTGMTGVAAQMCDSPEPEFKEKIEKEMPDIKWGARTAILNDISPAATFIAYNYNTPVNCKKFLFEAKRILTELLSEHGWMYETQHVIDGKIQFKTDIDGKERPIVGEIEYIVWSDLLNCPNCLKEINYWEIIKESYEIDTNKEFICPFCGSNVNKLKLEHATEQFFDNVLGEVITRSKKVPVLINYWVVNKDGTKKRFVKNPDTDDLEIIKKIDGSKIGNFIPIIKMMFKGTQWGDLWRSGNHIGISHVHHFYTRRNLIIISAFFAHIDKTVKDKRENAALKWILTSFIQRNGYIGNRFVINSNNPHGRINGPLLGTFYVPSLMCEQNIFNLFNSKANDLALVFNQSTNFHNHLIFTNSSTNLGIPSNSIDYIFVDPPFGQNLMYSEINFLWESWLRLFTNTHQEAIVNETQKKGLAEYQLLMETCFKEFYRIIKPGRWLTIEFHNSQNSVWHAIQEALQRAGFVISDIRILDKKGTTIKQSSTLGAVKKDLIISAYKPNGGLEDSFKLTAGTIDGVWDFIRQHLKHLPVFVEREGNTQVIDERQSHLLFDRMIAFHVQRGVIVPISAGDFYVGLRQRFPERDEMYFLENQVLEYDKKRMSVKRIEQDSFFVHDEKRAIRWLRKVLTEKPQTKQDIHPQFLQELHQDKFEKMPELGVMLEQNFLQDLQGKWYVPDPNKQADLDKVRERALLKEFEEYKKVKGKLKIFRTEAVRAGFKKAWSDRDYSMIISVGERLPSQILQEDDVLLMYYDNALTRQGKS